MAAIVRWDVHRIIVAHGNVVEHDAARAFHEARTWLYGAATRDGRRGTVSRAIVCDIQSRRLNVDFTEREWISKTL